MRDIDNALSIYRNHHNKMVETLYLAERNGQQCMLNMFKQIASLNHKQLRMLQDYLVKLIQEEKSDKGTSAR